MLVFLIKGLFSWREEDPGRSPYVFCIQFVCKGLSGLSESFEVDGLVVKVSSQFWRNWQAPKAQACRGSGGILPQKIFIFRCSEMLFSVLSRVFSLQNY